MTEQITWEVYICRFGTDHWEKTGHLDEMPNRVEAEEHVFGFIARTLGFWENVDGFKFRVARVLTQHEEAYQGDIPISEVRQGIDKYLDEVMK